MNPKTQFNTREKIQLEEIKKWNEEIIRWVYEIEKPVQIDKYILLRKVSIITILRGWGVGAGLFRFWLLFIIRFHRRAWAFLRIRAGECSQRLLFPERLFNLSVENIFRQNLNRRVLRKCWGQETANEHQWLTKSKFISYDKNTRGQNEGELSGFLYRDHLEGVG